MKLRIKYSLLITFYVVLGSSICSGTTMNPPTDDDIEIILEELVVACSDVRASYAADHQEIEIQLAEIKLGLYTSTNRDVKIDLLLKKDSLTTILETNKAFELTELSKIRYLKGLQIIKILYEKTLSLDHHFASVSTLREINKMSNPNSYPAFASVKSKLESKQDKKAGFDLTGILGSNIYTSVVHSFVSLFTNSNTPKIEKDESIKEIECILDFTLRMHNDLNTIYFETVFLQKSNHNIMADLQQLFIDYTEPIAYSKELQDCRNSDDWGSVRKNLNVYLEELNNAIANSQNDKAHLMQINLHFPIDRLLQFITQYNIFIDQGGKFYEKFDIMLGSYENEQKCVDKIPAEYKTLKEGITVAVEKFNTAYKPIEINGSKMKEVLYGINEYD